jgi:hypothetical protein
MPALQAAATASPSAMKSAASGQPAAASAARIAVPSPGLPPAVLLP